MTLTTAITATPAAVWSTGARAFRSAAFRRYLVVGLASRGVQTLVLFITVDRLGLHYILASFVAVGVVVIGGFLANKFWTFEDKTTFKLPAAPKGYVWRAIPDWQDLHPEVNVTMIRKTWTLVEL